MNDVSKVIFDALVARQRVVLPGVGSLEVKRRKAKKISDTQIVPPQNVVLFSTKEPADDDTVADLLAAETGISRFNAGPRYEEWLESVRTPEGLVIEEVGEIYNGEFAAAESFHNALNPVNEEEVVTMEKERKKGSLWMWLVIGVLLAGLIFVVLFCGRKGCFDCKKRDKTVQTSAIGFAPALVEPAVEPVSGDVTSAAPAVSSAPLEPRYHVIAGAFAIESNADRFLKKVKREHPELAPEKIYNPSNGYNMISILSAPTERQARNKMSMYWDIDLYLWVYKQ